MWTVWTYVDNFHEFPTSRILHKKYHLNMHIIVCQTIVRERLVNVPTRYHVVKSGTRALRVANRAP